MAKLCIYLPPFASDYTGVCSTLFEIDCLTAINDASCCTAHYVYYDEPRWSKKVRPIFCTQLRTIDAVMGDDNKVVDCVLETAETIESDIIAIVGTPVPAITGMDMVGIANEIENRCGKMTFGFSTTGFDYYDKGIAMVQKALIHRLAIHSDLQDDYLLYDSDEKHCKVMPNEKSEKSYSSIGKTTSVDYQKQLPSNNAENSGNSLKKKVYNGCYLNNEPVRVNIIGLTPLDYGDTDLPERFRNKLEKNGIKVNASLSMNGSIDDYRNITNADICIAVSAAGLAACKYIKIKFGIPYIAAAPIGSAGMANIILKVKQAAGSNFKHNYLSSPSLRFKAPDNCDIESEDRTNDRSLRTDNYKLYIKDSDGVECDKYFVDKDCPDTNLQISDSSLAGMCSSEYSKVVIAGDQVMSNSLRDGLRLYGCKNVINVVSFFGWDKKIAEPADKKVKSEKDFIDLLRKENYDVVIADPMFANIPEVKKIKHLEHVHPAVSGKLHWKDAVNYLSPDFDSILKSWAYALLHN